jgi:integrase
MIMALNTTMRGCELKGLRWRDVDFMGRTVTVRRKTTKNNASVRIIPLNADAWTTILELWERSKTVSGINPDHFVLPACEGGKIDPTRAIKTWRTAWRSLTRAAGLRGLRFHDMRHHAITELSESEEASDQTIMSIAGHVSPRMLAHYSHVRLEAKRKALDGLSGQGARSGYGTKHGTIDQPEDSTIPQVIEKMVDVTGFEPATPCLQRLAARRINNLAGMCGTVHK